MKQTKTKKEDSSSCWIKFADEKGKWQGLELIAKEKGMITNADDDSFIVSHDMCEKFRKIPIHLKQEIAVKLSS